MGSHNTWNFEGEEIRGARGTYRILKTLGESGAYGDSFEAVGLTGDYKQRKVFVKVPNLPADSGDFIATRDRLALVFHGIFSEFINYNSNLENVKVVAQVHDAGIIYKRTAEFPVILPFLVQELVDGKNLRSLIFSGANRVPMTPLEFSIAATSCISAVKKIHEHRVVHGDLHPANLMVQHDNLAIQWETLRIVDFGQAFLAQFNLSAPEHGPARPEHTYKSPERRERSGHWSFCADIYSLGVILFALAVGQEPRQALPQHNLSSFIRGQLQTHNPLLLSEIPALPQIIAKCCQDSVVRRYQSASDILRDYQRLSLAFVQPCPPSTPQVREVMADAKSAFSSSNPFVVDIVATLFDDFESQVRMITSKPMRFEFSGDREVIISLLVRFLRLLNEGDEYLTITTPLFWNSENLGLDGRFLAANEVLLRRGVKIKRAFLCTAEDIEQQNWKTIRETQIQLKDRVEKCDQVELTTTYEIVEGSQIEQVFGAGHIVGLWVKDNTFTSLSFSIDEVTRIISRVTIMELNSTHGGKLREAMTNRIENGREL